MTAYSRSEKPLSNHVLGAILVNERPLRKRSSISSFARGMTLSLPPAELNSKTDEGLIIFNTGAHEDVVRLFFNYSELIRAKVGVSSYWQWENTRIPCSSCAETARLEEATKSIMLEPSLSCQLGMSSWEL